jgi:hypothetical protein
VSFVDKPGSTNMTDLTPFVNHTNKTVTSTTGELSLDYGRASSL